MNAAGPSPRLPAWAWPLLALPLVAAVGVWTYRTIDPFLERLILSCLAKRPGERPADAGVLLRAIEDGWTGAP